MARGWRRRKRLSLDNSHARFIGNAPAPGNGTLRGAGGTTDWTRYEIELPVPEDAQNIAFGLLLTGTGTAWFDALSIELDGEPYSNPQLFDFDFESPRIKGFGYSAGGNGYKTTLDGTTACSGHQSVKMQFIGDSAQANRPALSK